MKVCGPTPICVGPPLCVLCVIRGYCVVQLVCRCCMCGVCAHDAGIHNGAKPIQYWGGKGWT